MNVLQSVRRHHHKSEFKEVSLSNAATLFKEATAQIHVSDGFAPEGTRLQGNRRADSSSWKFNCLLTPQPQQTMPKTKSMFATYVDSTVCFEHRKLTHDSTDWLRIKFPYRDLYYGY